MQIFPAIDLKNGQCVRLFQGDFSKKTVVNEDPIAQAKAFATDGATYLHIVDLDGALEGRPINLEIIQKMKKRLKSPFKLVEEFVAWRKWIIILNPALTV